MWATYLEVLCSTAATLLGLLFVSVSVNARAILGGAHKHSQRLAEQAFQNYLAVLVIGLMALYPNMGEAPLGVSLLTSAAVWSAWVVVRLYQTLTATHEPDKRITTMRRFAPSVVGLGFLFYGGAELLQKNIEGRDLMTVGLLCFLISATVVSWQLLVSIGTEIYNDVA